MAQTVKEWYDSIAQEKASMSELAALEPSIDNSNTLLSDLGTSRVDDHRLWMWVMAVLAWMLEVLFDKHKAETESIIEQSRFGTLPWYKETGLMYQHGDSLVWINNQFTYSQEKDEAKLVNYVAPSTLMDTVVLKVAKQNNNRPEPLSASELNSYKAYWSKMQPPGQNLQIVSNPADLIRIELNIYYDALLLLSDGTSILTGLKPVETAINDYLNSIEFSGVFDMNEMIDKLQSAEGVKKPYPVLVEFKPEGSSTWTSITTFAESSAGYFTLDQLTINYISYV